MSILDPVMPTLTGWQTFIIALLAALPPTLTSLAALWQAVQNGKQTAAGNKKIDSVHEVVNGALQKAKDDAYAKGVTDGKNGTT